MTEKPIKEEPQPLGGDRLVVCKQGKEPIEIGSVLREYPNISCNTDIVIVNLNKMYCGVWRIVGLTKEGYILLYFSEDSKAYRDILLALCCLLWDEELEKGTKINLSFSYKGGELRAEARTILEATERYIQEEEPIDTTLYMPIFVRGFGVPTGEEMRLFKLRNTAQIGNLLYSHIEADEELAIEEQRRALSLMGVEYSPLEDILRPIY